MTKPSEPRSRRQFFTFGNYDGGSDERRPMGDCRASPYSRKDAIEFLKMGRLNYCFYQLVLINACIYNQKDFAEKRYLTR